MEGLHKLINTVSGQINGTVEGASSLAAGENTSRNQSQDSTPITAEGGDEEEEKAFVEKYFNR